MAPSMLARVATLAVAVAAALAAAAAPAAACSCMRPPPLLEVAKAAEHVVRVKVTKTVFLPDPLEEQGKRAIWEGRVGSSFKGCTPRLIRLTSGANSALCGVRLTVGEVYLFLLRAAGSDGSYSVSSCDTFPRWADVGRADRRALRRINSLVCPPKWTVRFFQK